MAHNQMLQDIGGSDPEATGRDDILTGAAGDFSLSGEGGDDILTAGAGLGDAEVYRADLGPLSGSGVNGQALLTFNDDDTLTVQITATGLEPDMVHAQHIHGLVGDDGEAVDSTTPTLEQDADGDGFIELAEGLVTYGPILVPLTSPPGGAVEDFPTAPDGTILFEETYDLTDESVFAEGFDADDISPLDFREIVLHGRTTGEDDGEGTPGEVDGTAGFKVVLPVAAGEIELLSDDATVGVTLDGGRGNDLLVGNAGDDFMFGGRGSDTFFGDLGDDTMRGDESLDVFVFSAGNDTILDFDADEGDRIVLANDIDVETAMTDVTEDENGVTFSFDEGDSLTLAGVSLDQFGADDMAVA